MDRDKISRDEIDMEINEKIIIILTKPPHSERAKLCFRLIEGVKGSSILYLAGDGVFNLLSRSIDILPKDCIFACKEYMNARGVRLENTAISLVDSYERLVENMMSGG